MVMKEASGLEDSGVAMTTVPGSLPVGRTVVKVEGPVNNSLPVKGIVVVTNEKGTSEDAVT